MEVNEAKRLRELEAENNKLKKLLADKLLEVEAMKDVLELAVANKFRNRGQRYMFIVLLGYFKAKPVTGLALK